MRSREESIRLIKVLLSGEFTPEEVGVQAQLTPTTIYDIITVLTVFEKDLIESDFHISRLSMFEKIRDSETIKNLQTRLTQEERSFVAHVCKNKYAQHIFMAGKDLRFVTMEKLSDDELPVLLTITEKNVLYLQSELSDLQAGNNEA